MNFWQVSLLTSALLIGLLFISVHAQRSSFDTLTTQLESFLPDNAEAGVAIGLIDGSEKTVTFVGNAAFTEETLFEYGSITKVFTAIALAQLVDEGVVQLDESINPYLPEEAQDPKWEEVTLEQLATHSAGLPRLPANMDEDYFSRNPTDPYAEYDEAMLYEAVQETELQPSGEFNEYSNFGYGLLGTLLADVARTSYAELISTNVLEPLEMQSAAVSGWSSANIAPPLGEDGSETNAWTWDAMAATGAIRGNLADAVKFLEASMNACDNDTALAQANCRAQQATDVRAFEYANQGWGWFRSRSGAGDIVWHNGGTGGYSTFLGFNAEKDVGIVLLANVADVDVTGVGLEYLASLE